MKKGFTLIELLAVIIILAVIALIATPIVINVVQDAREKARQESIHGYAEAVILTNAENQLATTQTDLKVGANAKMKGETVTCETVVFSDNYGAVLDNCTVGTDTDHVYYFDGSNVLTTRPSDMDDRVGDVATNPVEITPTEESCFEYATAEIESMDINYDVCVTMVSSIGIGPGAVATLCHGEEALGTTFQEILSSAPNYLNMAQTYGAVSNVVTKDNGNALITGYTCTDKDLAIPSKIDNRPVTAIGYSVFSAKELTSVVIPDTVTYIGGAAFYDNAIAKVELGKNVQKIVGGAFEKNQITSVTIPSSVEIIGNEAFAENQIKTLTIQNGLKIIKGDAFYKNQLVSITIPNSVKTIEEEAFYINPSLASVTIGNGIETIGENAFAETQDAIQITIDKANGSIAGASSPWGATNATITYLK